MVATFTATLSEILDCERPEDHDPRLLGLNDYPIWDNDYRQTLNNKIVMRFWNREIGFETVDMFRLHMRRKMGEIMPYYNQLAKSAQLEYDPFETVNVVNMNSLTGHVGMTGHDTTTGETTNEGTETSSSDSSREEDQTATGETSRETDETSGSDTTSDSESVSRNVNSETPQTRLAGYEDYATSASDGKSQSESSSHVDSTGHSSSTENTESTSHTTGTEQAEYEAQRQAEQRMQQEGHQRSDQDTTQETRDARQGSEGVKAELLMAYRATLVNVDVMILNELETLFMGVWDVADSYTQNENYFGLMGYYYW